MNSKISLIHAIYPLTLSLLSIAAESFPSAIVHGARPHRVQCAACPYGWDICQSSMPNAMVYRLDSHSIDLK